MNSRSQKSIDREVLEILAETVFTFFIVVIVAAYGWDFGIVSRVSYTAGLLTIGLLIGIVRGFETRKMIETSTVGLLSFFVINYADLLTGYSVAFVSGCLLGAVVFAVSINISTRIDRIQNQYEEEA